MAKRTAEPSAISAARRITAGAYSGLSPPSTRETASATSQTPPIVAAIAIQWMISGRAPKTTVIGTANAG